MIFGQVIAAQSQQMAEKVKVLAVWSPSQKMWRGRVKKWNFAIINIWRNLRRLVRVFFFQTCGRSGKLWHRRQSCGSTWRSFGSNTSSRYLPEVLPGTFTLPRWSVEHWALQKIPNYLFMDVHLLSLLPKSNPTFQGWLTDSSSPFPIANLTCLTRR